MSPATHHFTCACGKPFDISDREYRKRVSRARSLGKEKTDFYCSRRCGAKLAQRPRQGMDICGRYVEDKRRMDDWGHLKRVAEANDRKRRAGIRVGLALVVVAMLAGCEPCTREPHQKVLARFDDCVTLEIDACYVSNYMVTRCGAHVTTRWETGGKNKTKHESHVIEEKPEAEAFK